MRRPWIVGMLLTGVLLLGACGDPSSGPEAAPPSPAVPGVSATTTHQRAPASPEIKRNIEAKYHLNEPLWKQYGRYLGDLLHGDFGPSLKYRDHTVSDIIGQALPAARCGSAGDSLGGRRG